MALKSSRLLKKIKAQLGDQQLPWGNGAGWGRVVLTLAENSLRGTAPVSSTLLAQVQKEPPLPCPEGTAYLLSLLSPCRCHFSL